LVNIFNSVAFILLICLFSSSSSCVLNVASVSGLSLWFSPCGFLYHLLYIIGRSKINERLSEMTP
jgi:hypothetical protein